MAVKGNKTHPYPWNKNSPSNLDVKFIAAHKMWDASEAKSARTFVVLYVLCTF